MEVSSDALLGIVQTSHAHISEAIIKKESDLLNEGADDEASRKEY
jgi:hypothetical protein